VNAKMKILICAIAAIFAGSTAIAAPKKAPEATQAKSATPAFDPVASFQSVVSRGSESKEWTHIYQNPKTGKWTKRYYFLGEVNYDVKKTDSLVSPIVGLVSFPIKIQFSPQFETEEEATNSNGMYIPLSMSYSVEGQYSVSNSAWKLDQFRYKDTGPDSMLRGSRYTMDEARLKAERNATISVALLRFLPDAN